MPGCYGGVTRRPRSRPFPRQAHAPPITARAVFLGLLLIPFNAYGLIFVQTTRHATLTNAVPFAHVIFVLVVLIPGNALVRRVAPHRALRGMGS